MATEENEKDEKIVDIREAETQMGKYHWTLLQIHFIIYNLYIIVILFVADLFD